MPKGQGMAMTLMGPHNLENPNASRNFILRSKLLAASTHIVDIPKAIATIIYENQAISAAPRIPLGRKKKVI
jgi:hypothetical protein